MDDTQSDTAVSRLRVRRRPRALAAALAVLLGTALTGCAALTDPVVDGIPVRRLPPELLGHSKNETVTIPLTVLERPPPSVYRLDAGDVLGVYIQGVLGGEPVIPGGPASGPPVHFPESSRQAPQIGYPMTVRDDGTVALPLVKPISVRGMTVEEAQGAIARAYTEAKVLQPGRERIIVTLARERTLRVTVFRQELGGFNTGPEGAAGVSFIGGSTKRGTAHLLDLPAYENDVMNALSRTGGLPGLDVCNEVVIFRKPSDRDRALLEAELQKQKLQLSMVMTGLSCPIIKIPLRIKPGDLPPPRPEDVLLNAGDVVFIEAREFDEFYTGGLLPPGEYQLPRDHDLDVIEALSFVKGPLVNGGYISSGTGPTAVPGIGSPSPRLLIVLRKIPGGQVPIRVDLDRAFRDPRERILVQPQDVLILQETPCQAVARWFTDQWRLGVTYNVFQNSHSQGPLTGSVP